MRLAASIVAEMGAGRDDSSGSRPGSRRGPRTPRTASGSAEAAGPDPGGAGRIVVGPTIGPDEGNGANGNRGGTEPGGGGAVSGTVIERLAGSSGSGAGAGPGTPAGSSPMAPAAGA